MKIGEWSSVGYVKYDKTIHRIWQWKNSNWHVTIPASESEKSIAILRRMTECLSESTTPKMTG